LVVTGQNFISLFTSIEAIELTMTIKRENFKYRVQSCSEQLTCIEEVSAVAFSRASAKIF